MELEKAATTSCLSNPYVKSSVGPRRASTMAVSVMPSAAQLNIMWKPSFTRPGTTLEDRQARNKGGTRRSTRGRT